MRKTEDNLYEEIQEILKKNEDAQRGFAKAAENAESHTLQGYFKRKAKDRKEFNVKLIREIRLAYPDIDTDGTFTGTIHRVWMDVKALFSADNDESMLEESIRGDKAAIAEYNDVLEYTSLPVALRDLLLEQKARIEADVNKNSKMEDLH